MWFNKVFYFHRLLYVYLRKRFLIISLCDNPEQSLGSFYTWLDALYDAYGFPCRYKVKSSDDTFHIKGTYHYMSGEEVQFLKVLENTKER